MVLLSEEFFPAKAKVILNSRFGHDTLIALASIEDNIPYVRTVNSYYEDGCFYIITHALSNKMRQFGKIRMRLSQATGSLPMVVQ